jgi:hypothetical protein
LGGEGMRKTEIMKFKKMLDRYVGTYFEYLNRDDYPDRPCVRKAVTMCQDRVFTLAEYLHELKIITFEECCEYWSKVGFVDEFNIECKFTNCEANINGICEYTKRSDTE